MDYISQHIHRSTIGRLSGSTIDRYIGRLSVDCRPIYRPSPPIVHKIRKRYLVNELGPFIILIEELFVLHFFSLFFLLLLLFFLYIIKLLCNLLLVLSAN